MKRPILLLVLSLASCGDDRKLSPPAPACTGTGCVNNTGVIGGGGGTSDASVTDTATDGSFDVGDAGVAVTAVVRSLARFTDDPATGTVLNMNVLLRANKFGGGTTDSTMTIDGTHTLRDVAVNPGVPTVFRVLQSGVAKAVDGAWLPTSAVLNLPLFNDGLPQAMWPSLVPTALYPANSAHVVIHVHNTAGMRRAGATSLATGDARGPFYDDGADIVAGRTSTGAKGTIVFLGSASSTLNVTVNAGAKTMSLTLPLTANAVTHFVALMD